MQRWLSCKFSDDNNISGGLSVDDFKQQKILSMKKDYSRNELHSCVPLLLLFLFVERQSFEIDGKTGLHVIT